MRDFWSTALEVWVSSVVISLVILAAAFASHYYNKRDDR